MGSAGNMSDEERALGPKAWKSMMSQEHQVRISHRHTAGCGVKVGLEGHG